MHQKQLSPEATASPPFRYSVAQPGYDAEVGRRLRILLDGVEQADVIEYDCEAGTILKNKRGPDGLLVLNLKRDEIVRETLYGTVTVRWKDGSD